MTLRIAAALFSALFATGVFADGIAGVWKHVEEPGWIEIRVVDGVANGTVLRNDKFPERVGRQILKDAVDTSGEGVWNGQVYAECMGEYKDAEISLIEPDRLRFKVKVGFISRSLEWQRAEGVPAPADN